MNTVYNNWNDIAEKPTLKQKILGVICGILVLMCFMGIMLVGKAYEEHRLCLNGATEYCIDADFR